MCRISKFILYYMMTDIDTLKAMRTTGELLAYILGCVPPLVFPVATFTDLDGTRVTGPGVDIIVQDEYTHDFVVPVAPRLFLVYDTT